MRGVSVSVGIDVGGTKIEGVLLVNGKPGKRHRVATPSSQKGVLEAIGKLVTTLSKRKELKVGVSFPGFIQDGLLKSSPNIPSLEGKPLVQLLRRYIKQPIIVENDANCFVLAEQRLGSGKGSFDMVGLIIGTGIGTGVVVDGHLLRGHNGGAGELGHIPYGLEDVESFAAGPGIVKRFYAHGGHHSQAERIFELRTHAAKETVKETVDALAFLCSVAYHAYDPEVIVIGGGVSNAPIIKKVGLAAKKLGVTCKITRHSLGDSAGSLGAALLAAERL